MIELKKVTFDMYDDFVKLAVHQHQEPYVASAIKSLAQAYVYMTEYDDPTVVYGIFADEKLVGFIKYCYYREKGPGAEIFEKNCYHIWRLFIDKGHQGKGYGKAAVEQALAIIKTKPHGKGNSVYVSYEPENAASKALFASFGFMETDKKFDEDDDEIIARLEIV